MAAKLPSPRAATRARFLALLLIVGLVPSSGAVFAAQEGSLPSIATADPALCNDVVALPCERWSADLGSMWSNIAPRAIGAGGLVFVTHIVGVPPNTWALQGGPTTVAAFTEDGTRRWAFDSGLNGVDLAPSANGALLLIQGHRVDATAATISHVLEARQGHTGDRLWRVSLPTSALMLVSPDASSMFVVREEAPCGKPDCVSTVVESYDPSTGSINWKSRVKDPTRGAILSPESGRVFVLTNSGGGFTNVLHSVDAVTGRALAHHTLTGVQGQMWLNPSDFYFPKTAAVSSDGSRIFFVEESDSDQLSVLAFSTASGGFLWRSQALQGDWSIGFMLDASGARAVLATRYEILTLSTQSGATERVVSISLNEGDPRSRGFAWVAAPTAGGKQLGLVYTVPLAANGYMDSVAVYDVEKGSFGWRASARELHKIDDFHAVHLAGSLTSGRLFVTGIEFDAVCYQTQNCDHQNGRLIGFGHA